MADATTFESIDKWEAEERERLYDPDLDLAYVDQAAHDVADVLTRTVLSAEVCFQPGDGTRYPLVFVPVVALVAARPRVVDGREWATRAVEGLGDYDRNAFLVAWVEGACYPLRLGGRHGMGLAASYVAEHWKTTMGSGATLALLFRAVAFYLDRYDAEPKRDAVGRKVTT